MVAIEFHKGALLEDTFDAVMIDFLRDALYDMFITPPSMLLNNYETADDFLVDLTKVAGSVVIVLDEIGKAFEREIDPLDDLEQRDEFLSFCENIFDNWFSLNKVFFVVLGRASYLNYVEY